MNEIRLGVIESRFADIVWERAPLSTSELIKLCEAEFKYFNKSFWIYRRYYDFSHWDGYDIFSLYLMNL